MVDALVCACPGLLWRLFFTDSECSDTKRQFEGPPVNHDERVRSQPRASDKRCKCKRRIRIRRTMKIATVGAFVLVLATPLFARDKSDVLIMNNGDHLTCEIKGLSAGILYVSLDYIQGTGSVDWSKVRRLES